MATLLEFPHSKGLPVADSRYQKSLAAQLVFWRAHDIQYVKSLLEGEFPTQDVGGAIDFARVVLHPADGKETLAKYVRGILHRGSEKLAA